MATLFRRENWRIFQLKHVLFLLVSIKKFNCYRSQPEKPPVVSFQICDIMHVHAYVCSMYAANVCATEVITKVNTLYLMVDLNEMCQRVFKDR